TFHRGFVEAARVDLAALARDPEAFVAAAPLVRSLSIANMAGAIDPATRRIEHPRATAEALGMFARTLARPCLRHLRALDIIEPAGWTDTARYRHGIVPLGDDVAAVLAAYGSLPELRALGISGGELGPRGLEALGALAQHVRLERLWLRGHRLEPADVGSLLARFPAVVDIDLAGFSRTGEQGAPDPAGDLPLEAIGPLLERPLVSLAVRGTSAVSLGKLARSPAARTIAHLALADAAGPDAIAALELFPRLRSLELACRHRVSDATMRLLANLRLPALRELAIGSFASAFALGEIAGAFGDRLEVLDVRGAHVASGPEITGEVIVRDVAPTALLHATAPAALAAAHRATRNDLIGLPAAARAYLVGLDGQVWQIPALESVRIGRSTANDIVVDSTLMSRAHAELTWRGGAHCFRDLGSASGSWIDDRRPADHTPLRDGALLRLASVALRYVAGDDAEERVKRWIVDARTPLP
ncbi:MAG: FHA domain-containing protein, partial [Deltaproteobacteria bacterium]|nr:FHA domain-containing protein [Deltaproteobacteria bacterium]